MTTDNIRREFMEAGFTVFPLWDFDGEKCNCSQNGCASPGKHPRATNWQNTPENTPEKMEDQEEANLYKTGYGVLCRGLLVVDVDARNGGVASYAKLIEDVHEVAAAGMIVETGSGGGSKHLYFSLPSGLALVTNLKAYPGIDFKSSGFVVGAGSMHVSGNTYRLADGTPYDIEDAPERLIKLLVKPKRQRLKYEGHAIDVGLQDLQKILSYIPNEDLDYEDWIKVGMAIHHSTGGREYLLWDNWSELSSKYDDTDMEKKWHSFGKSSNPVTIGTLIHEAKKNGYKVPLGLYPEKSPLPVKKEEKSNGLPFDTVGIDLTRPPGWVGELSEWIESCNRRPRRLLSVSTALVAVSNIMGLRYRDARDGITPNLFCINIAGSRTGKESLNQSIIAIHRAAGVSAATVGNIKSEQEIIRNLIEHQCAFYVIDEIGFTLRKIRNAQNSNGGAAYLEAVIGVLMSAYSKANGYMPIGGDVMREVRKAMKAELAQLEKSDDQSDWKEAKIAHIAGILNSPEPGLKNPFLSVIGYTTGETFNDVVDYDMATNGFIGRSLLFTERETAPRSKVTKGFEKPDMPMGIDMTIKAIASGGEASVITPNRIEYPDRQITIETDDAADKMLEDVLVWFEDQAVAHKATSGLESLYLGAYELVAKISFILAVPERLRTSEHVRWAFELIRRDVDTKARLVVVNEREKDSPELALRAKIANLCDGDDGETLGVIINRTRNRDADDVKETVEKMIENGLLVKLGESRKGMPRVKYVGDG